MATKKHETMLKKYWAKNGERIRNEVWSKYGERFRTIQASFPRLMDALKDPSEDPVYRERMAKIYREMSETRLNEREAVADAVAEKLGKAREGDARGKDAGARVAAFIKQEGIEKVLTMTSAEIGKALGISPNTVRIQEAWKKLRPLRSKSPRARRTVYCQKDAERIPAEKVTESLLADAQESQRRDDRSRSMKDVPQNKRHTAGARFEEE